MYLFRAINGLSTFWGILFQAQHSTAVAENASTQAETVVLPLNRHSTITSRVHTSHHTSSLTSLDAGVAFSTSIKVGNQTLSVFIDTGSSSLWLVSSTIQRNLTSGCNLGETYTPSLTFTHFPNITFYDHYGSGEEVTGILDSDTVTLAGLTVQKQEIGLPESGSLVAPGQISGLMGLAYPVNNIRSDGGTTTPIFTNMYEEKLVPALFSLAIERLPFNTSEGPGGYLALGGLPPVKHSPVWATADIVTLPGSPVNATTGKTVN